MFDKLSLIYENRVLNEALTERGIETIQRWISEFGEREASLKMLDYILNKAVALSHSDLSDTTTFMYGLDSMEEALKAKDYQGASDLAKEVALEMLDDEGYPQQEFDESKRLVEWTLDSKPTPTRSHDRPVKSIWVKVLKGLYPTKLPSRLDSKELFNLAHEVGYRANLDPTVTDDDNMPLELQQPDPNYWEIWSNAFEQGWADATEDGQIPMDRDMTGQDDSDETAYMKDTPTLDNYAN